MSFFLQEKDQEFESRTKDLNEKMIQSKEQAAKEVLELRRSLQDATEQLMHIKQESSSNEDLVNKLRYSFCSYS